MRAELLRTHGTSMLTRENFPLVMLVLSILVHKLGGRVVLSQNDFDEIAGMVLGEDCHPHQWQLEVMAPQDPRLQSLLGDRRPS